MTVDELIARESIRDTLARYNHAGDGDRPEEYAATFAPDAVFEAPGFRHEGRQAILDWKRSHRVFGEARFRQHHVSGTLISLTGPDAADVTSNWIAVTNAGPDHCGRYIDKFERCDGAWLIKHRRVEIYWRAGESFLGEEHMSR